ncbi:MAG: CopD family protein [Candidatus Binataceae bacterium]
MLTWIIILHVFGVVFWIGSLLVVSSLMTRVPDEIGAAREALIVAARRLLGVGAMIGAAVTIVFGIGAIMAEPIVLTQGWLHAKLLLVLIMLGCHVRLYRRVTALENDPGSATRREFAILHGLVSALLLLILALVFLRPF